MTDKTDDLQVIEVIACIRVADDADFPRKAGYTDATQAPCLYCLAPVWVGVQAAALSLRTQQPLVCVDCVKGLMDSPQCERIQLNRLDPTDGTVHEDV